MSIKPVLSFFALAAITSFSVVACTASTDTAEEPTAESQDQDLKKSITACNTDDDCVAVPQGGCCSNGWLAAVNKHHTQAYENATKCKVQNMMCPMYVVDDTRVAQCNTAKKQCEMVHVEDIACGGFIMNAHQCPDGYTCDHTGKNPDTAGTCVKETKPADCRTTGCSGSSQCSVCWGHYACIPKGAMC